MMAKLFGIAAPWCSYKASHSAGTVTGYVDVAEADEEALKEAVGNIGPISVAIDANHNEFMSYKSGIYYNEKCSSTKLDHGVLVSGYGTKNGQDYWIVKNSWNTNWGEEGYVRMARNRNNNCGVATPRLPTLPSRSSSSSEPTALMPLYRGCSYRINCYDFTY